jgi:hypothetical protein
MHNVNVIDPKFYLLTVLFLLRRTILCIARLSEGGSKYELFASSSAQSTSTSAADGNGDIVEKCLKTVRIAV